MSHVQDHRVPAAPAHHQRTLTAQGPASSPVAAPRSSHSSTSLCTVTPTHQRLSFPLLAKDQTLQRSPCVPESNLPCPHHYRGRDAPRALPRTTTPIISTGSCLDIPASRTGHAWSPDIAVVLLAYPSTTCARRSSLGLVSSACVRPYSASGSQQTSGKAYHLRPTVLVHRLHQSTSKHLRCSAWSSRRRISGSRPPQRRQTADPRGWLPRHSTTTRFAAHPLQLPLHLNFTHHSAAATLDPPKSRDLRFHRGSHELSKCQRCHVVRASHRLPQQRGRPPPKARPTSNARTRSSSLAASKETVRDCPAESKRAQAARDDRTGFLPSSRLGTRPARPPCAPVRAHRESERHRGARIRAQQRHQMRIYPARGGDSSLPLKDIPQSAVPLMLHVTPGRHSQLRICCHEPRNQRCHHQRRQAPRCCACLQVTHVRLE